MEDKFDIEIEKSLLEELQREGLITKEELEEALRYIKQNIYKKR